VRLVYPEKGAAVCQSTTQSVEFTQLRVIRLQFFAAKGESPSAMIASFAGFKLPAQNLE
jgi:hypothetical protein